MEDFVVKKMTTRTWVLMGLMTAISIILTRFLSFSPTNSLRFSLGQAPIILTGIWLGPIPAVLVGMVSDILGVFLASGGGWIPFLTLAPMLVGLYSGLMARFYMQNKFVLSLLIAIPINFLVRGLYFSYALSVAYDAVFSAILTWRLVQCAILTVAETAVIYLLLKSPAAQIATEQKSAGR